MPDELKTIYDSPTDETLKLLIENLALINQAVTTNADYNKKSIDEILLKLSKINITELIETLKLSKDRGKLLTNIIQRIADSKQVDVRAMDMDYVLAELIIDAYQVLVIKRKYEVVRIWARRIGWGILTTIMSLLLAKITQLIVVIGG